MTYIIKTGTGLNEWHNLVKTKEQYSSFQECFSDFVKNIKYCYEHYNTLSETWENIVCNKNYEFEQDESFSVEIYRIIDGEPECIDLTELTSLEEKVIKGCSFLGHSAYMESEEFYTVEKNI